MIKVFLYSSYSNEIIIIIVFFTSFFRIRLSLSSPLSCLSWSLFLQWFLIAVFTVLLDNLLLFKIIYVHKTSIWTWIRVFLYITRWGIMIFVFIILLLRLAADTLSFLFLCFLSIWRPFWALLFIFLFLRIFKFIYIFFWILIIFWVFLLRLFIKTTWNFLLVFFIFIFIFFIFIFFVHPFFIITRK